MLGEDSGKMGKESFFDRQWVVISQRIGKPLSEKKTAKQKLNMLNNQSKSTFFW